MEDAKLEAGQLPPYLQARQAYDERMDEWRRRTKQWQWIAAGCVVATIIMAINMNGLISNNHPVPYAVEVDRDGTVYGIRRADRASLPQEISMDAIIAGKLRHLISIARTVSTDRELIQRDIVLLKHHMNPPAWQFLTDYYEAHEQAMNPLKRAENETVAVHIHHCIASSKRTYECSWGEEARDLEGGLIGKSEWTGRFLVSVLPDRPATDQTVREDDMNPFGIFVDSLTWTAVK